ncbi:helix-turn-helix domain-containing protein [Anabaena cylindrica FACHB-243]|uniref:Transcriptional regulator, Crp/Fnr family with PAS/PAC sensor n=1 Tax=Anabaena cylindrica (strain ATCC 27899 / PCC 7122) TaxID=272123 RepID=K9ZII0_ANACC|nr:MULTISPECIES: helix-turn-helix domain-containing protein [Anabaena]AFZ59006.1 putative transcriptional regulator, Crp/Fnr family with PAS/PAC sensor [Anabaena cylindrica PCC 7122]MBD2420652.1 helix-turn-helix domain-containing protein [Anabaena cylindrica FACHB-243]MBY5283849.1 helix-turn-helix domain-containing protein [Anabaena sp. CCAP 1446/1C]MBY5310153.1 helix-turn-helix domain-containing protein [Anabaena sp. CCAP 1446/1C]MCM2408612.1 helix-turn-helix domain-containing protein [Anabae
MNIQKFIQRAEVLNNRLADLYQTATVLPFIPSDLLPDAFKDLYSTSKMVQLAVEELYQQNEELIETRNLLETERQHYQDLFEFAPDAYLVTNPKGIIKQANTAAAQLLNISSTFLVGKPIITFINREQHPYFYDELIQIFKSLQVRKLLLPFNPRDGDSFNASVTVKAISNKHGKLTNYYWLIHKTYEYQQEQSTTLDNHSHLIENLPVHKYSQGDTIPLYSQLIWYVRQGLVKLNTFCETGKEVLTGLATAGMVFGSSMTSLSIYQATALKDVELVSINISEINVLPNLSHILLPKIQQRLQQTESFLFIAGRGRVQDRLQHLLELLKDQLGEPVPEGTRLTFRFTHEEIASACCTTRVTITRLLSQLQQQGFISFDAKKHIIIKNSP